MSKRISVFSINYWTDKGYSEEDAKYQISIRRPNNINYWLNKGYDIEDATFQVKKHQRSGFDIEYLIKKYGSVTGKEIYEDRVRRRLKTYNNRKEYWLDRGYSEEDALKQISDRQNTRSYAKAIEKYGLEAGVAHVQQINKKWIESLQNKSEDEINRINKLKGNNSIDLIISKSQTPVIDYIELNYGYRKNAKYGLYHHLIDVVNNCENYEVFCQYVPKKHSSIKLIKRIINCPAIQLQFSYGDFGVISIEDVYDQILSNVNVKKNIPGLYGNRYYFDGNILLSDKELEIARYLKESKIKYRYSKLYPFSTRNKWYFYDFYIEDIDLYVEFAGIMDNEKYRNNINKKIEKCNASNLKFIMSEDVSEIINTIEIYFKNDKESNYQTNL